MIKRSGGDTNLRLRFACVQPLRHGAGSGEDFKALAAVLL